MDARSLLDLETQFGDAHCLEFVEEFVVVSVVVFGHLQCFAKKDLAIYWLLQLVELFVRGSGRAVVCWQCGRSCPIEFALPERIC